MDYCCPRRNGRSLLMECAGEKLGNPPHTELQYKAVELCGHLPLASKSVVEDAP